MPRVCSSNAAPGGTTGARLRAVERIHDEHRIARLGEALAHLPERGAQAQDVGPHEHRRVRAARGCTKYASQVPSGVLISTSFSVTACAFAALRQHHREADAGREAAEVAARHASCANVFLEVLFEMVLLAHDVLPLRVVRRTGQSVPGSARLYRFSVTAHSA